MKGTPLHCSIRRRAYHSIIIFATQPWIVGSRFTEYKGGQFKQGRFSEWELLPMDAIQRRELATKLLPEIALLLSVVSSPSPIAFVTLLEKHSHAAAWGNNPLLFSLAAVVFVKTGGLPAGRAALYNNVIEAILTLREQDSIYRIRLLRTLSSLALWLQQGKGRTFTINDLLTFLEDEQKTMGEEAVRLAKRMVTSGILDVVAYDTYGFRHQTFQEYLAAVELAQRLTSQDTQRREETWQFIWQKRMYSRWTEVLRLMVGALAQLPGNKGHSVAFRWLKALLSLREAEEGDPGELGLALALKSIVEVTEISQGKSVKVVQLEKQLLMLWWHELLLAVRNRRKTKGRLLQELVQDVRHLRSCDREFISKSMVLALRDDNRDVRDTASDLLRELGDWVPTHVLLPMLRDTDEFVKLTVIEVLGSQGDHIPLDALFPLLQDLSWRVREAVIRVLGMQGERVPLDTLLAMLRDTSGRVRSTTIKVLGAQGERVPLDTLLPMFQDQDKSVRQTVIKVLGAQGERVPLDTLLPMLQDQDKSVRWTAIEVLGAQSERVSLDVLFPMLQDEDGTVRRTAIKVLGSQGEQVPLDVLLPLLRDKYRPVREAVTQALDMRGEQVPMDVLLPMLRDQDKDVRETVIKVLDTQGKYISQDVLTPWLRDQDKGVRQTVIKMLDMHGEHIPLDALLPALRDEDWTVRRTAIKVLGRQGERHRR